MKVRHLAGAMTLAVGLATGSIAFAHDEERVQHYEAKESKTLEQAVEYFSEYNARVAEVLAKDQLTVADMETIHQLSYTIENALAKIRETLPALAATLEELHLASEEHNEAKVRGIGEAYLETAQTLIP